MNRKIRVTPFSGFVGLWIFVGITLAAIATVAGHGANAERFNNYVGVVAVLVNFCGFLLVFGQLRATSHATENQTRWEIEQVSFNVYKMLVDQPELRPYFYDGVAPPSKDFQGTPEQLAKHHELRLRVESACELLLDYFETIVSSCDVLDDKSEQAWFVYMTKVYGQSAALKQFLASECERYTRELIDLLDPALAPTQEERLAKALLAVPQSTNRHRGVSKRN